MDNVKAMEEEALWTWASHTWLEERGQHSADAQTFAGEIASFCEQLEPWNFLSHVLFRFLLVCLGSFGFLSGWVTLKFVLWGLRRECGWKVTAIDGRTKGSELKSLSFLFSSWKCKQPHHFSCLVSRKGRWKWAGTRKSYSIGLTRGFVMENYSLCCYYGSSARM